MSLQHELDLKTPFESYAREAVLSIYYTGSVLKKRSDEFFRRFNLTDVQFNVLMLLKYQSEPNRGLSQSQISRMMLVNRANITTLIDRMEKSQLALREPDHNDRRYNIIILSNHGRKLLEKVEPLYQKEIDAVTSLSEPEQKKLISLLEKLRANMTTND